jgi:two-component system OmpR family sensor kinase
MSNAVNTALSGLPNDQGRDQAAFADARRIILLRTDESLVATLGLVALISGSLSALFARRVNRPLAQLDESVKAIADGDYSQRAHVSGPVEVVRLGESFNRMADSLEDGEHLRRQLVADLAHELRNPLAAAQAQAEAMIDGILPMDAIRLESLLADIQHITSLMNDLQELATVESGRIHYQMAEIDLSTLIEQQVRRVSAYIQPDVTVVVKGTAAPTYVEGDALRLSQVLRNILANAKRHTVAGSITVSIQRGPGTVTVRVTDTGEGIPPAVLPHVFERFYRADASRSAETGGSGLGLSISRSIIRDHGGDMFANSTLGLGTTVGFTLPIRQPASDAG